MRANEFIIEDPYYANVSVDPSVKGNPDAYIKSVADEIRSACGPFIQANQQALQAGLFMYRGVKGASSSDLAIEGTVRTDRIPRDTPIQWHDVLDQFFLQKFGTRYRSAAMFATNDINNTFDYGTPYVMFPKGEYKICYSPIVEDMTVDLAGGVGNSITGINPIIVRMITSIPSIEVQRASRKVGLDMNQWSDFLAALADFTASKNPSVYGPEFKGKFETMLIEFFLPKLRYRETKQFYDAGDSELMVKCGEYYGVRVDRHNREGHWMQLLKMIVS